ncbi:MAG: PAS domain-containing protein [Phycisphaerae bacterium]|nr:PAS domain-containing protein [Gemmatimonadaceae bacterium]
MSASFDVSFLDAVLHTIPGGVFVYDCESRHTVFATRAFYELLGFEEQEEPYRTSQLRAAVIHDDDRASVKETLHRAAGLPRHQHAEVTFRLRLADGEWRWVNTRGAPLFLADTKTPARYLVGVAEDVTARRKAAEALAQSADSLRLAQELANVGSYDRNLVDGNVHWSEQMFRIHGADPVRDDPNSMGDLIERFVHPDDRTILRKAMRQLSTTGRAGPYTYRVVRADGTVRNVVGQGAILRDADGLPLRRVGSVIDVTARTAAEEERVLLETKVREVQKLESLGVLAGGIAHDFNNLLVGILGNASVSLLDMPVSSPAHAAVTAIERAARDAASLTRQLLAYAGKGRFLLEPLDLSVLVRQLRPVLQTALGARASLISELADHIPVVHADAEQLRQAIVNVVTNAAEAIGERAGTVKVMSTEESLNETRLQRCLSGNRAKPGLFACISVNDDGIGMDEATLARVFDPFFSTRLAGRGLGLAATLGIVHGHSGALEVSSAPGRGTTMRMYFPAAYSEKERIASAPANNTGVTSTRSRLRVLVVDDDAHVRALAHRVLERLNYDATEVSDGVEALDFLRLDPTQVDAVLLDMTMPRMNGEDTLRGIRALAPWMPVILMSGHDEREVTPRLLEHGLGGYLQKPFTVDALASMFARVVGPPDRVGG